MTGDYLNKQDKRFGYLDKDSTDSLLDNSAGYVEIRGVLRVSEILSGSSIDPIVLTEGV